MIKITKEMFLAYEKTTEAEYARGLRDYMTYSIMKLTGLTEDEVNEIQSNWQKYNKQYNEKN